MMLEKKERKFSSVMSKDLPIIFIHGIMAVPYDPAILEQLKPNPVLAPYLPGYGNNLPDGEISLEGAADFIRQQLDKIGYEQAHIVGHSMGGAVAVIFAKLYPEKVASFINVEGNFTLKDAFFTQKLAKMSKEEAEALVQSYRQDPENWLKNSGIEPSPQRVELAIKILNAQEASTLQAMSHSTVEVTKDKSYLEAVAGIFDRGIPVHLVAGEHSRKDWDTPDWVVKKASSLTIQPGVGHMLMLENPAAFVSIIKNLVQS